MNVLLESLEGASDLIKYAPIEMTSRKQTIVDGFPEYTEVKTNSFSHIQPLTPFEKKKSTDSTLDSKSCYKFYILDNLVEVLNGLNQTDCYITWNNRKFNIFSKDDWSANGWIKVIGAEVKSV